MFLFCGPQPSSFRMSRKNMPWNAARRLLPNLAKLVHAAIGANRNFSVGSPAHVNPDILHGWRVAVLFVIFQRPLPFGPVNSPEIADAGVLVRSGPVLRPCRRGVPGCDEVRAGTNDAGAASSGNSSPLAGLRPGAPERSNLMAKPPPFVALKSGRTFVLMVKVPSGCATMFISLFGPVSLAEFCSPAVKGPSNGMSCRPSSLCSIPVTLSTLVSTAPVRGGVISMS